uniref:Uncharacterized protein n=1 Tax=uncultured Thiotrichaceae bacterium TaxID=298394 RepID=A0A6S6UL46_9GAMM|nr:MAG: Unknown protein [uncultured Thiotrichaceae bacterium]
MDELVEGYDNNRTLISVLSHSIETWEDQAPEFAAFNQRLAQLDSGSGHSYKLYLPHPKNSTSIYSF